MRATAAVLDKDHPEMITGDHLRDAARVLEHGSTEGARRHLRAAMETLTPLSLTRHGIRDDDGHALAKHHLHEVHRHHLAVEDIDDAQARNDRLREAAAARRQPGQEQESAPPAGLAAANPPRRAIELKGAAWKTEKRDPRGEWTRGISAGALAEAFGQAAGSGGGSTRKPTGMAALPAQGMFGRRISKSEAGGFAEALAGSGRSVVEGFQAKAAKQELTKSQRAVYAKLRKAGRGHYSAMLTAKRFDPRMLAAAAFASRGPAVELVGPHGYSHGWVYHGDPHQMEFAANLTPGSLNHIRAIEDLGRVAARNATDFRPSSPTLGTSLHHLARSLAQRDMKGARLHLASAKWADQREAGGAYKAELAAIEAQLGQVNVHQSARWMPRLEGHGAHAYGRTGTPLEPTRGALRIPEYGLATELSARTAMLERTPAPRGRPGGPGLYDVKGMGHTPYLQQIVKALIEKRGMPSGKAYAIARGAIRKWMRGGGHVHPEVRAAAGRAEAGEIARQARAKASHGHAVTGLDVADMLIELACEQVDLVGPKGYIHGWIKVDDVEAAQHHLSYTTGRAGDREIYGLYNHANHTITPRHAGYGVHVTHIQPGGRPVAGQAVVSYPGARPRPTWRAKIRAATESGFANDQPAIELYNPYHAGPGQGGGRFTSAQGAGSGKQKQAAARDRRGDRAKVAAIRTRIAGLESQLRGLEAQLRASAGTKGSAGTKAAGAKRTAAAAAKRTAKAGTAKTGKAATARGTSSASSLRAQITALRVRIAGLRSQLAAARA